MTKQIASSQINNVDLFDESVGYEDEASLRLSPALTAFEVEQARILYHLFNELWGLLLVVGDPGAGKDLFGNWLSFTIKRYFPWKRILRDERPRQLFGTYAGLFNPSVLSSELSKMRKVAKGDDGIVAYDDRLEKAADEWVTKEGTVLLKNSVLYLTEFWRYCSSREPHSPMNKTMGGINKQKRHIDSLIIGTTQQEEDLDRFTCRPWVDWKVICTRSTKNKYGFVYWVQKVKYDKRKRIFVSIGRPYPIPLDAGKPRYYMGDGKIKVRKYDYLPESEEERIILDILKAGIDTYESMVEYLVEKGAMTEVEILSTLKDLKFIKRKRVIDYPCYFGLYNSKSAPTMSTSLKLED